MASPCRFGPTRAIFMHTVVDHATPGLSPRNTLATTIHDQLGAQITRKGTGSPASHPANRMRLRPYRSLSRPAKKLVIALTIPKVAMKERIALLIANPN